MPAHKGLNLIVLSLLVLMLLPLSEPNSVDAASDTNAWPKWETLSWTATVRFQMRKDVDVATTDGYLKHTVIADCEVKGRMYGSDFLGDAWLLPSSMSYNASYVNQYERKQGNSVTSTLYTGQIANGIFQDQYGSNHLRIQGYTGYPNYYFFSQACIVPTTRDRLNNGVWTTDFPKVSMEGAPVSAQTEVRTGGSLTLAGSVSGVDSSDGITYTTTWNIVGAVPAAISSFNLFDLNNEPLKFLSADNHPYFDGYTRLNGTITVKGNSADSLKSLQLDVIRNNTIIAKGSIVYSARTSVFQTFGSDQTISISTPRLLWQIKASDLAAADNGTDGKLKLRIVARTTQGGVASYIWGDVSILVRYEGNNRFGTRDAGNCAGVTPAYICGGDDWVLPSVRRVVQHFSSNTYNDFSNMNGGSFPVHDSHQNGVDVDGRLDGYGTTSNKSSTTAKNILAQLNDSTYGSCIQTVFVAFTSNSNFAKTIANVKLKDGRMAVDVIKYDKGHADHFHWRIKANCVAGSSVQSSNVKEPPVRTRNTPTATATSSPEPTSEAATPTQTIAIPEPTVTATEIATVEVQPTATATISPEPTMTSTAEPSPTEETTPVPTEAPTNVPTPTETAQSEPSEMDPPSEESTADDPKIEDVGDST